MIILAVTIFAACNRESSAVVALSYFPVQKEPVRTSMDGDLRGALKLLNGSLYVEADHPRGTSNFLIIWPYGYSFSINGNQTQVLDEKGQPRYRVGDNVLIGGGEITSEFAKEMIGKPLPSGLDGPFWLAANASGTPFVPTQRPDYRPPSSLNSRIGGQLAINDYLLRLKPGKGESLLAIWPYGYTLQLEGQQYRLYDDRQQPMAWAGNNSYAGDSVEITGGEVTGEEISRSIGLSSVPGSWKGPYWLVTKGVR